MLATVEVYWFYHHRGGEFVGNSILAEQKTPKIGKNNAKGLG